MARSHFFKQALHFIALAGFSGTVFAVGPYPSDQNPDGTAPLKQCGNLPSTPTPGPGPDPKPTCENGLTAPSQESAPKSVIDNVTLNYRHFADDFRYESPTGCASCSASPASGLPDSGFSRLALRRIHSLRSAGEVSSFGPGVFLSYDISLTLFEINGVSYVDCYSPQYGSNRRLSASGTTFLDGTYLSITGLYLYDANGALTTSRAAAVRAVMVERDGTRCNFDIFTVDGVSQSGRLISVTKSDGTPTLTVTYAHTVNDTAVAPDFKWRRSTVQDSYGNTLTFAYTALPSGLSAISGITLPGGGVISYGYDVGGQIASVNYPNGDTSTFSREVTTSGLVKLAIFEAGEHGAHRAKTGFFTATASPELLSVNTNWPKTYNQSSQLIRQLRDGAGDMTYWSETGGNGTGVANERLIYEGGGRLRYNHPGKSWYYKNWNVAASGFNQTNPYGSLSGAKETYGSTGNYQHTPATHAGALPQVTDENGVTHNYQFDSNLNRTSESVAGMTRKTTYDPVFNKPIQVIDATGRVQIMAYDDAGRIVSKKSGWMKDAALGAGVTVPGVLCQSGFGASATPVDSSAGFNAVAGANCYVATLTVATPGVRTFYLSSSYYRTILYIDGVWTLSPYYNQGERAAAVNLTAGTHTIRVDLDGSGYSLLWSGPETTVNGVAAKAPIGASFLSHTTVANEPVLHDTPLATTETWEYYPTGDSLAGLLKTHVAVDGKRTEYAYDSNRRATTVKETGDTGSLVTIKTFTYDTAGNVASVTDAVGRVISYAYDSRNRLAKTSYTDNTTETILYGSGTNANVVVQTKDRAGSVTKNDYDAAGRVASTTYGYALADNDGNVTQVLPNPSVETFTYLVGDDKVLSRTRDGKVTEYAYDHKGRLLTETTRPSQGKTLVSAVRNSDQDQVYMRTDAHGCRTFYGYRASDKRLVREIRELAPGSLGANFPVAPSNWTYVLAPGAIGSLTNQADTNPAILAQARDMSPNPGYAITDYTLDNEGRTIAETDARGIQTTIAYDAKGRVASRTSAAGTANAQTVTMTYDAADRVLAQTDALNRTTSRTYTPAGRMASVTLPDGKTQEFTYYADGKLSTRKDEDGFTSAMTWSQCCGREFGAANPKGEGSLKFYDGPGRVTYQVLVKDVSAASGFVNWTTGISIPADAVVSAQTMKYDARGRLVASTKWNTAPSAVDPHNPPIAPAGSTAGFTTTYAYFDDLSDSRLAPVLSQLAAQGKTLTVGSATIVTNPAGEQSFSITDGAGRSVASGSFN